MNILFISPNSPFESTGGVERYVTNLISYYSRRTDCRVYFVLPTRGESHVVQEGNITIYYESSLQVPRASHVRVIAQNAAQFISMITEILEKKHIDIICAENFMFGPPAVYSLQLNMIASLHNIPLVLRLHSFTASPLQAELTSQLMWSMISCVSQSVAGDCFQKGCDIDLLSTDYLGVNTSEFFQPRVADLNLKSELKLTHDAKIILTAARIVHGGRSILQQKGIINLIRAFSKIYTRYPNTHLLIAVANPPASLLAEFSASLEMLMGYIKLHGIEGQTIVKTYSLAQMPQVYQGSDMFVLASENETFGQVFVEAMSCGVPVVGTKVGGIPEIISDSYNGYLIQPNDASILAQRIERLLNDDELKDSFVKAGLKTVNSMFSAEKQFGAFHEKLLLHARSSPPVVGAI